MVSFLKPEDFGTLTYADRRASKISARIAEIQAGSTSDLLVRFDKSIEPSWTLRNYLWAHKDFHLQVARKLVEHLSPTTVAGVLQYLAEDYWGRYLGWPDLFLFRKTEYMLVEVKGSGDTLSENQKTWVDANHRRLLMPFRLVKVHKKDVVD